MKLILIQAFITFHLFIILIAPLKSYKPFEGLAKVIEFYTVPFYFQHSWALFSPNPGTISFWNIKTDENTYNWPTTDDFNHQIDFIRAYYFSMDSTYLNYENIFLPYLCRKHSKQEVIQTRFVSIKLNQKLESIRQYDRFNCKDGEFL